MNLILERLSLTNVRLKTFARIEADLHTQFLELTDLREQVREAQVWADLQNATRARRPAPTIIASAAGREPAAAAGSASGVIGAGASLVVLGH